MAPEWSHNINVVNIVSQFLLDIHTHGILSTTTLLSRVETWSELYPPSIVDVCSRIGSMMRRLGHTDNTQSQEESHDQELCDQAPFASWKTWASRLSHRKTLCSFHCYNATIAFTLKIHLFWCSQLIPNPTQTSNISVNINNPHKAIKYSQTFNHVNLTTANTFFLLLTLKVLNFWKITSYCSSKPLWSGMGEVVPACTSPTLHPPSPPTVHQLSWLAL